MKDTEKIVFWVIYGIEQRRLYSCLRYLRRQDECIARRMKTAVLAIIGLGVFTVITAQDTRGKPSEARDASFMARSVRAKLFPFRGFCGKYGDPCGILIPCCEKEGFECDSGGFHIGKCLKDWKKK